MLTFISLIKMTNKGRVEFADSLQRGELAKQIMQRNGVTMTDYYFTLGRCDVVMMFEAETAQGMAQTMAEIGRLGAIETETMLAFGKDAYGEIQDTIGKLDVPNAQDQLT